MFAKYNNEKKGSIYYLIIRSFAALAGIVLLFAAAFYMLAVYIIPYTVPTPNIEKLLNEINALTSETYADIDAGGILGIGGYFEILDADAKIVYCSDKKKKNEYAKDIFQYVPSVDASAVYDVIPMEKGEEEGWLLLRYDGENENQLTGMAVLDANRVFVYSNIDLKNDQISEDTLGFLFFNADEKNTFIQQYKFQAASGEIRHMFIHSVFDIKAEQKHYRNTVLWMIAAFIVLLVLLLLLVGMLLSRRVTRPMKKLSNAITQTAHGNRIKITEGEEPKEIFEVIQAFNEMEEALTKSEEEQKKLYDQRRKMVADISHDLKTPVTVIQGYADAINDGLVNGEKKKAYLQIIGNKAGLLAELINSFGDYSRLDHPGFQMNMEEGDLCEYVREYIAEKYDELELSGYALEADIPDIRMNGSFDKMQLKRAFENIIVNSVKHTDPGTIICVCISQVHMGADWEKRNSSFMDKEWMRIELGDNGPGIMQQYRETIFEPFVIGDESRTSGKGTGLGLSIARQIIRLHGGEITLMDKPGTVFCIMLPLK